MVVGAFPAAKLGALLLKQISKPIANVLKTQAKSSPIFRKYVCMPPAQFYNWCEVKAKMWVLNLGKPVNIPVLSEAMAIELGANLLGEGIIFVIAAGILVSEYNRSSKKEEAKEALKKKEMSDLQNTLQEVFIQSEEQRAQLRELTRKIGELETKIGYKPPPTKPPSPNLPLPKTSGPTSSEDILVQDTVRSTDLGFQQAHSANHRGPNTLIFKAVSDVENQFWNYPLVERQNSIVVLSLYYVQWLLRFGQ